MMRKIGLLLLGGLAAFVLLAHLGPMVVLALSLVILYFVWKQFLKANSTTVKFMWAIAGVIALTTAVFHAPAILGVAAAYVLYLVYKKWNGNKASVEDPFVNFEKQWIELKQNY